VIILVVVLIAVLAGNNGNTTKPAATVAAAARLPVTGESVASSRLDDFTHSVAKPTPPSTVPSNVKPAPGPGGYRTTQGASPGLYGGTRNNSSCDRELLINYLVANPDKAGAWALVEGINPGDIPGYIRSLTPVILRVDTRVINHGFANGVATRREVVLEAGTAVLVDSYGMPRAKCYCGNPLLPPTIYREPVYTGTYWPTFYPSDVVVVTRVTQVTVITIIDVVTGDPFDRPVGTDGPTDADTPGAPTTTTSTTTTTTTAPPETTTLPTQTAPPTTAAGPTDEQRARSKLDRDASACYPFRDIQQDTLRSITFSAGPDSSSFILTRVGTLSDGSTQTFKWQIDRQTLAFTPLNDLAQRANNDCPALGRSG
jgi:hypothetical protein